MMRSIAVLVVALAILAFPIGVQGQAIVNVYPASQNIVLPDNVTVHVNITGVSGLYGFQFDVNYNPSYVEFFDIIDEGGFLSGGTSSNVFCVSPTTSSGTIENYACTRTVSGEVSGDGDLAVLNLSSVSIGTSPVTITDIRLSDSGSNPISFTSNNGQIVVGLCTNGEERDCGPLNNTGLCEYGTSTCSAGVWGSCVGSVYPEDETCDGVDQDCDGVLDGSEGLTQQCGTTDVGVCEYGSQSCDDGGGWSACSGEINPGTETCPHTYSDEDCDNDDQEYRGDRDCNGVVNILDLSFIGTHFGETPADGSWDATADLVANSEVDIFDLVTVGSSFGNTYN
jgi:hypothetical protein